MLAFGWRIPFLLAIPLVSAELTTAYALTSYMPTYLEEEIGLSNLTSAVVTVPVLVVMSLSLPLLGSLPTVATHDEARDLVDGQDENPLFNTSTMPIPVAGRGRRGSSEDQPAR